VTALQSLSKSDIIEFYQQFIRVGGAHRSKVSAQIFGKGHSLPSSSDNQLCVHVANEIEFRRSMPLFASAL
jgi:secreted Zn-dependent insulinase-like peptidase